MSRFLVSKTMAPRLLLLAVGEREVFEKRQRLTVPYRRYLAQQFGSLWVPKICATWAYQRNAAGLG